MQYLAGIMLTKHLSGLVIRDLLAAIALMILLSSSSVYAAYPELTFTLDDVHSPVLSAKMIRVHLSGSQLSRLEVRIGKVMVQGKVWHNLTLSCYQFHLTSHLIDCTRGKLYLSDLVVLSTAFRFIPQEKTIEIDINPVVNEHWRFSMRWDERIWRSSLTIINGQSQYVAQWLPNKETLPLFSEGRINGVVTLHGNAQGLNKILLDLSVNALAFSDRSGLHAGENVNMAMTVIATRAARNKQWEWQSDINWLGGEIFWQPIYLIGSGQRLSLNGTVDEKNVQIHKGKLVFEDIGQFDFSGVMVRSDNRLRDFELRTDNLELSNLFDRILKPFLENTVFSEMEVSGYGALDWRYRNGQSESLILDLNNASVIDKRSRFAFEEINAHIPWKRESMTTADISILNGEILRIPLGNVHVPLKINNFNFSLSELVLPVLDGALKLEEFSASYRDHGWQWQFSGELFPVSMEKLTAALQIQKMHGTLSGVIPWVNYDGATIAVDGTLLFNVFDGTMVAKNLILFEPLGLTPHLKVDLEMRNLDLDLLTRTFSFGSMQGRIDMDMHNLELASWRPTKFDANLLSSPGSYPRRISQAAIQNISALGGMRAAAIIQRSFLRFFKEFGYSKIGWRCSLRNNVCRMGGIESESDGYVIVKGGGVPAITVMGYNQDVSWHELVNRLKRVTQGNDPIIQ
ncbi:hypothetical protein SAMN05216419_100256 [Nitrosomonas cryotolerans]|uniref:Dicarboxylate transport n=1 Tax=Nitrosomonas cryotolerans ATCC 49181 TaxID=1131553 RepID=A0A1N6GSJ4_9PROT|nr:hypothetical protein [Nitrosomonas cryotolerans]SFP40502.1 hypothetical protein SAMN05216419_100256 [Nitrosomonas cryotolerans]SIO10551.1 hypothetical protein SAMN02743940_0847 [Nitrosomonas cryotolerans ATCC 49181]